MKQILRTSERQPASRPNAMRISRSLESAYIPGPVEVHNLNTSAPFIAKNYSGYRIVFASYASGDKITSYTSRLGISKQPSPEQLHKFKQDIIEAAKEDQDVMTFLKRHSLPN